MLQNEAVPTDEKVVLLFEVHADVIAKDRRDTYYDHKIFLTTGRSNLILNYTIPIGNRADSTWTVPLLRRQNRLFGAALPRQASYDH